MKEAAPAMGRGLLQMQWHQEETSLAKTHIRDQIICSLSAIW